MALPKVKANVNNGKGGSRWNRRAACKAAANKHRRTQGKKACQEIR